MIPLPYAPILQLIGQRLHIVRTEIERLEQQLRFGQKFVHLEELSPQHNQRLQDLRAEQDELVKLSQTFFMQHGR
ncbi:MAG: hypothetical protein ACFCUI_06900 [Bernardetiaceae bacterium]